MTQQEDIKNAVECMRKGGVISYGYRVGHRLRCH